jgi:heme iron utilization protein
MTESASPALIARGLVRAADRAALATIARRDTPETGAPYASLVLVGADHDASPLLLISKLADHTKNIEQDPHVSLLFDGTAGLAEPLTGPRVTVQGTATITTEPRHRARYLARHPGAAMYADFKDFAFYRVSVTRAHLVAGFGRIHWLDGKDVTTAAADALMQSESGIIEHMNSDHADALQLYANVLLGKPGGGWVMTGIDPDGIDMRAGGTVARLPFVTTVRDSDTARAELVRLVHAARANAPAA